MDPEQSAVTGGGMGSGAALRRRHITDPAYAELPRYSSIGRGSIA